MKTRKASTSSEPGEEMRSSQRYRVVFEHAPTAMLYLDGSLTILLANVKAAETLGLRPADFEGGRRLAEFLPPGDAERLARCAAGEHRQEAFRTGLVQQSGATRDVFLEAVVLPDDGCMLVSIIDFAQYAGDTVNAQHQHDIFRSLFANSPEAILRTDATGRIADVNPAFERMFGYLRAEVVGKRGTDLLVPPGLMAEGEQVLRGSLEGGIAVVKTTRVRSDGKELLVSVLGAPVVLDGRCEGAFGIYRDITQQQQTLDRLADAFIDLVETTSRAMASADPYTAGHQRRVGKLADLVGRRLGMDDDTLQGIYVGAMLHDIGKLSIPSTILTKPGALSRQEWSIIRTHPTRGHAILADANLPWPVADMALKHHERLDGSGYPGGLRGWQLGPEVRVLAACDVVEAMSSNRPYRPALPIEKARDELQAGSGTKFDSDVVAAIVRLIDEGHIQPTDVYEGLADDRL
jgi:PAS domain S-box-containing protein